MRKIILATLFLCIYGQSTFAGKSVSFTIIVKESTAEGMVKEQCRDLLEKECEKLGSSLDRSTLNIRPLTKTSRTASERSYTCHGSCK
jgi:hypothetical protein